MRMADLCSHLPRCARMANQLLTSVSCETDNKPLEKSNKQIIHSQVTNTRMTFETRLADPRMVGSRKNKIGYRC